MKSLFMAGAASLVLTLAACGGGGGNNASTPVASAPVANVAAPNGADWTQTVSETQLGFLMGNPNAPVKLVEYASITCPHCGEFTTDGGAEGIRNYVRSGRVSWEYRPFMLGFPTDPGLFALLRCNGAASYFDLAEQLYADQRNWVTRAQTFLDQNQASLANLEGGPRARAIITGAGLDAFFRQRGMTQQQIDQCLADPRNLQRVAEDTQRGAQQDNVSGTPTFFINGVQAEGAGLWTQLEPRLRAAVGG